MAVKKSPSSAALAPTADEIETKRKADAEAAEKARIENEQLTRAQTAHAQKIRYAKLARRDPMVAEIYNRMQSAEAAVPALGARILELETALAEATKANA